MHVLEESSFNWVGWATRYGLGFSWSDFFLTNVSVIVFGISAAAIGYRRPALALSYPALMLVNALFFHLLPTLVSGRPNPGFITALVLFVPLSIRVLADAMRGGVQRRELAIAMLVAVGAQCFPLVLLGLRSRMAW